MTRRTEPQVGSDPEASHGRTADKAWPPPVISNDDIVSHQTLDAGQRVEVPVIEEQLSVQKRQIETGQVVVHIEPTLERQEVEVPLVEETVEVERVPINRFIEAPVPVRQEGDVTIVPVFEEVVVIEKRLMLKEEIRLVRRKVATNERRTFELRKEQVHVLRTEATDSPESAG